MAWVRANPGGFEGYDEGYATTTSGSGR
jgi:hypothetical protein